MFCWTDSVLQNILHIQSEYGEYSVEYCQSPQNIVMDLNNAMTSLVEY